MFVNYFITFMRREIMSEPFIGEIIMFAGNFAPRGWALCDGQIISIASNQALYSIIGTTYGGDGIATFGLPDLRGRVPVHEGTGPGLSSKTLGQRGGTEYMSLTSAQLPSHNHLVNLSATGEVSVKMSASSAKGDTSTPGPTTVPAQMLSGLQPLNAYSTSPDTTLLPINTTTTVNVSGSTALTGAGQPVFIEQPFLALNFIIATVGDFPSRN
jgi:microcystin-dependent protein